MVDLQSTNRTKLSKVRETDFGVIPANPVFKAQRANSNTLNSAPQTVVSNEIRSDRQVSDLILVGQQAAGDVVTEFSWRTLDDDFEEALQGSWANTPGIEVLTSDTEISDVSATTLTVAASLGTPFVTGMLALMSGFSTAANNKLARVSSSTSTTIVFPSATFTAQAVVNVGAKTKVVGFEGASGDIVATVTGGNALTSTSLDFTTLGLQAGDWVLIGHLAAGAAFAFTTTPAANGWARVSAVAANRLSFDIVPTGFAADAGTSKTIRVFFGDRLRNASVKRSNTFERQYLDHSPVTYEYITGLTLNTMAIALAAQSIINVTKTYMGSKARADTARVSGATDIDVFTTEVMQASDDVAALMMDGSLVTGPNFVMGATISINNNLRAQNAIGSVGPVGIGNGEFNVTLSPLTTYFGSKALYDKLLANTSFGFRTMLQSPEEAGQGYMIDLPRCQMQTGQPQVSGKNADVMLEGSAQAIADPVLGYTLGINRFWFLPQLS